MYNEVKGRFLISYSYRSKYIGLLASFFLNSKGKSFNETRVFDPSFKCSLLTLSEIKKRDNSSEFFLIFFPSVYNSVRCIET